MSNKYLEKIALNKYEKMIAAGKVTKPLIQDFRGRTFPMAERGHQAIMNHAATMAAAKESGTSVGELRSAMRQDLYRSGARGTAARGVDRLETPASKHITSHAGKVYVRPGDLLAGGRFAPKDLGVNGAGEGFISSRVSGRGVIPIPKNTTPASVKPSPTPEKITPAGNSSAAPVTQSPHTPAPPAAASTGAPVNQGPSAKPAKGAPIPKGGDTQGSADQSSRPTGGGGAAPSGPVNYPSRNYNKYLLAAAAIPAAGYAIHHATRKED